jgi:uncharacterized Zn-binding protein involved in type VI secretion
MQEGVITGMADRNAVQSLAVQPLLLLGEAPVQQLGSFGGVVDQGELHPALAFQPAPIAGEGDAVGVKTHVNYDADCPIYAAVSTANVNGITAAKAMPVQPQPVASAGA